MIVYNFFQGESIDLITYKYNCYVNDKFKIMVNFTLVMKQDKVSFDNLKKGDSVRDIVVYDGNIYAQYYNCTFTEITHNSSDYSTTILLNGEWEHLLEELPGWVIVEIRQKTINRIIDNL